MPPTKPNVGVTGPNAGGWPAWICTKYLLRLHGARAVRITPSRPHSIDELHGLIIGGGADIHPARYQEEILPTIKSESRNLHWGRRLNFLISVIIWLMRRLFSVTSTSRRQDLLRDSLEFHLLGGALERRMPVLGICRGGQLINVFFGGALHQDISGFYTEKPNLRTLRPRKLVHIEKGTTLSRLLGKTSIFVNSLHNQSVKTVGRDLRITARENNGVIQAIEHTQLPFMVGVQWHPEFLPLLSDQRRIFAWLSEAARAYQMRNQGTMPPTWRFGTSQNQGKGAEARRALVPLLLL